MKTLTDFFRPHNIEIQDPPLAKFIFSSTAFSIVWLVVRVWLGWQWVNAASHKIFLTDTATGNTLYGQINPAWMVTGEALKGYWLNALKTDPRPVIYFDWYRNFIQYLVDVQAYTWFAQLIAIGELLVGIALILGIFTGIAAFFGAFMNWNFLMAGTASSNPFLFVLALLLVLAWKNAGYIGVDRWLLPLLGTPWKVGYLLNPNDRTPNSQPAPVQMR
jgi:thiosulfate dehydrogenase [quinone] large subunit